MARFFGLGTGAGGGGGGDEPLLTPDPAGALFGIQTRIDAAQRRFDTTWVLEDDGLFDHIKVGYEFILRDVNIYDGGSGSRAGGRVPQTRKITAVDPDARSVTLESNFGTVDVLNIAAKTGVIISPLFNEENELTLPSGLDNISFRTFCSAAGSALTADDTSGWEAFSNDQTAEAGLSENVCYTLNDWGSDGSWWNVTTPGDGPDFIIGSFGRYVNSRNFAYYDLTYNMETGILKFVADTRNRGSVAASTHVWLNSFFYR